MQSVYGDPKYAGVQKDLEQELSRLRRELKVPEKDPPETARGPRRRGISGSTRQTQVPYSCLWKPVGGHLGDISIDHETVVANVFMVMILREPVPLGSVLPSGVPVGRPPHPAGVSMLRQRPSTRPAIM